MTGFTLPAVPLSPPDRAEDHGRCHVFGAHVCVFCGALPGDPEPCDGNCDEEWDAEFEACLRDYLECGE